MITQIRRFLGVETDEEKLLRFQELEKSLSDVDRRIDLLADDFSDRYREKTLVMKSDQPEFVKAKVNEKFEEFLKSQRELVVEVKKEKEAIKKQLDPLLKIESFVKILEDEKNYSIVKGSYKEGVINSDVFDKFYKAKQGKVFYADNLVFNEEGKLLLLKRSKTDKTQPDTWVIPGGHVDLGEEFEDAAKRELQEESGLNADQVTLVGEYSNNEVQIKYYRSTVNSQEQPVILQESEMQDYVWIDPNIELCDYEFPFNMKDNIKKILGIAETPNPVIIKAIESGELDLDKYNEILKSKGHKYIRREGTPGNYKYVYEEEYKQSDFVEKEKLQQERSKELDSIYQQGVDFISEKLKGTGFEVDGVSKSLTDFGKSWYIKIKGGFEGQQIRISDHEVGDRRLMNDPTLAFINYNRIKDQDYMNAVINSSISILNKQVEIIKQRKEEWDSLKNEEQNIEKESEGFVENLKKEGKALHNSNRTLQTLEEVKIKHPDWEHIHQNKEYGGGFNYDYIKKNEGYGNYNLAYKKDYFNYLKREGVLNDKKSTVQKAIEDGIIDKEKFLEIMKSRSHKYSSRTPDGKGGWDYEYPGDKKSKTKEAELEELEAKKIVLLKQVEPLAQLKKKLYSKVDIGSPKSEEEKKLDKKITDIFSEINSIVQEKNKIKKEIEDKKGDKKEGNEIKNLYINSVKETKDGKESGQKKLELGSFPTSIISESIRGIGDQDNSKQKVDWQLTNLRRRAEAEGFLRESVNDLKSKSFNVLKGTEAEVLFQKNKSGGIDVLKAFDPTAHISPAESIEDFVTRIDLYNQYFPETSLEFKGVSDSEKGLAILFSQPFIDGDTLKSKIKDKPLFESFQEAKIRLKDEDKVYKKVASELKKRHNFAPKYNNQTAYSDGNVNISDVHLGNVMQGVDGKLYFIDMNIEPIKGIQKAIDSDKVAYVMGEFKAGNLKDSAGNVVTDRKQAIAIAISEAKRKDKSEEGKIEKVQEDSKIKKAIESLLTLFRDKKIDEALLLKTIEKSRTGVYADTAYNRKLHRVGHKYGSKGQEETPKGDKGKNNEQPTHKDLSSEELKDFAEQASESSLQTAIKESPDPEVRKTAHEELDRRTKEEHVQEEKDLTDPKKVKEEFDKTDFVEKFRTLSDEQVKFYLDAPFENVKKAARTVADERGLSVVSKEDYIKSFEEFKESSISETSAFYKEDSKLIRGKLSLESNKEQAEAINNYIQNGYVDVRSYLVDKESYISKQKEIYKGDENVRIKETEQIIKNLSDFIQDNKINKDIVLNRMVKDSRSNPFFSKLNEGDIYEDKSFSSTSLKKLIMFGDFYIKILAKKGSGVANINNPGEFEYLIDKGSKFRVLEKSKDGITVELL